MRFAKAHGLGNDFILVAERLAPAEVGPWARRLCDRHRGIGGDGILLHAPAPDGVRMRLINADGGEAEISGNGLRCLAIDDTWTGPAKEGCPADIYLKWRIEGLNGLAIGDIGWVKDPYTSPSTIRFAAKGYSGFQSPVWQESWFPDAFAGTMGQLLIALETGTEPAISGRDNLKTMALVDAAYRSVEERRAVPLSEVCR